jgi:hypothetical protein
MKLLGHTVEAAPVNFQQLELGLTPEFWTPTYVNGWASMAGFTKPKIALYRGLELVNINMVLDGLAATSVIPMTLPNAAWWPVNVMSFAVSYWTGAARALGTMYLTSTGQLQLYGTPDSLAARDYYSINCIFSTNKG